MTAEQFVDIVTIGTTAVSLALALVAVLSGVYILWIYMHRNEEAPFLTRLVHRDIRVAGAAAVILIYLALALSGFSLGRPGGAVVIAFAVNLMVIGVIDDAVTWYRERRHYGQAKQLPDSQARKTAVDIVAKLSQINDRLTEQGDRAEAEIKRTDEHQVVQDERITDLEPEGRPVIGPDGYDYQKDPEGRLDMNGA